MGRKLTSIQLYIYQQQKKVGILKKTSTGALTFQYNGEYLAKPDDATPLSLSLPLREEIYKGDEVHNYFENLLPDNKEIRAKVAQVKKANSTQTFDLLQSIGADCVGAIQFLGEDSPPKSAMDSTPISNADIAKTIRNLSFHPLGLEENDDFRISIAGAQEKTALLLKDNLWHKPQGSTPTTHILKPPMGHLQNGIDLSSSVDNEWLCLEICRQLGLKVAKTEIQEFEDQRCLVVERFDRHWKSKTQLERIPQEDLCQALNSSSALKYEADGGPGIKNIMDLLMASDDQMQDRSQFLRAQIVNYLLAATDGHAKNYSLFLTPEGFRMTPIYDVLSAYPALDDDQIQLKQLKLAMAVGDKHRYRWKDLTLRHFEQTAKTCGFPKKQLQLILEEIREKLNSNLRDKIPMPQNFNEPIYESIFSNLEKMRF